jgi:rhomboid protease GluP
MDAREATVRHARAEHRYFLRLIHEATPRAPAWRVLLAANLVVFGAMAIGGVGIFWPTAGAAIAWGANFGPLTVTGEWWRLGSSMFVHFGLIHIGFNMYALRVLGPFLERLYGSVAFTTVYLLAGLGGSLTSVATSPYATSAGASGAIFGLFGALLGFLVAAGASVPPTVRKRLRGVGLKLAGINLLLGVVIPVVDNAAHTGGLVVGFVAGVIVARPLPRARGGAARRVVLAALLAASMAVAAIPVRALDRSRFRRDFEQADRYLAQHPGDAEGHRQRGVTLVGLGRRSEARGDFERCLALEENEEGAHESARALLDWIR